MAADPTALAVAVSGTTAPSGTVAVFAGAVRATLGATTVMLTGAEVVGILLESVTLAVSTTTPAFDGVHENVYGGVRTVPTTVFVLLPGSCARNSIRLTEPAVVVAVRVSGAPKPTDDALAGVVSVTVGAATVTFTAAEVAVAPVESVARAEIATIPAVVGVHVNA
jgi:hypothetical protein